MQLRIGIELRKNFIVIDIKTTRNTSLTYKIPTICNKKSAIAWLIKVIKSPELLVENISLDDITRSNDEGNSSITIDSDISEKELLKKCTDGETDETSVWNTLDSEKEMIKFLEELVQNLTDMQRYMIRKGMYGD